MREKPLVDGSNYWLAGNAPEDRKALCPRQRVLVGLEGFVSLYGMGGSIYMATRPLSTMSLRYLQGTWFTHGAGRDWALIHFVRVCPALFIISVLPERREAVIGHLCLGIGLVAWMALEAARIVSSPGLQIAFGPIGGLITVSALTDLVHSDHAPEPASRG